MANAKAAPTVPCGRYSPPAALAASTASAAQRQLLHPDHEEQRQREAEGGRGEDIAEQLHHRLAVDRAELERLGREPGARVRPTPPSTIAPNTATISAPPIWRKKFATAVAVPSW